MNKDIRYKVQGFIRTEKVAGMVLVEPVSQWFNAGSHLDAAGMFALEHPEVNCETVLVVGEDYSLGSYPLEHAKMSADYIVGLRA